MVTRESHHAYFVSYRLIDSIKTCASIGNLLKESSYPFPAMEIPSTQIIFNILFKIFGYVKNSLYLCSGQRGRE